MALEKKQVTPPFKPAVSSLMDTKVRRHFPCTAVTPHLQYFDSEFTGQSVALTPPTDQGLCDKIQEEEEEEEGHFRRFSYAPPEIKK